MNHERHNGISEHGTIDRRRFMHRAALGSVACLGVPVLAGCEILAAAGDDRYHVGMTTNQRFEPASLVIPLGGTVIWENTAQRVHWVTADQDDLEDAEELIQLPENVWPWESGILYPGDTWALEFTVPGAYVYVDGYYYDRGMVGTILVEE